MCWILHPHPPLLSASEGRGSPCHQLPTGHLRFLLSLHAPHCSSSPFSVHSRWRRPFSLEKSPSKPLRRACGEGWGLHAGARGQCLVISNCSASCQGLPSSPGWGSSSWACAWSGETQGRGDKSFGPVKPKVKAPCNSWGITGAYEVRLSNSNPAITAPRFSSLSMARLAPPLLIFPF